MKRVLCLLFLAVLLPSVSPHTARAADAGPADDIKTPYYIVVDAQDPTVVFFARGADERVIPGSTMKIMTCILALERCQDLDATMVTVTKDAANMDESNSRMGVYRGETLTMRQLLYGLMLESGNDAALLIADAIGGSREAFAAMMNEKAAELGMASTHFINASGAYRSGQYSTARDMAVLACYAMKNEGFREIVSTARYTIPANDVHRRSRTLINSNKLISDPADSPLHYALATGIKTGSTAQGGKCLVSSAAHEGNAVIAVLLGRTDGGSKLSRMSQVFRESKTLLERALMQGYRRVTPAALGLDVPADLPVTGGAAPRVSLALASGDTAALPLPLIQRIQADPSLVSAVSSLDGAAAPVAEGEPLGTLRYCCGETTLFTLDFVAAEAVLPPVTPSPTPVAMHTRSPAESPAQSGLPQKDGPPLPLYAALAALIPLVLIAIVYCARRRKKRA